MSPSHFHTLLLLPLLLVVTMYAKSLELWDFTVSDGRGDPFSFAKLQHVPVSVGYTHLRRIVASTTSSRWEVIGTAWLERVTVWYPTQHLSRLFSLGENA